MAGTGIENWPVLEDVWIVKISADIATIWARLVIEELDRCGVRTFVVSPGSRSTPLVLALAAKSGAEAITHFDERGAGFFALGYARATGKPAALICTSGTAVANYLPAVIEASVDGIPMIVLSADRPPEQHQTGANQTIEQANLFGEYCRWRFTIPCPDEKVAPEFVLTTIDQAVYRATRIHPGPVHLNLEYREPLVPRLESNAPESYVGSIARWSKSEKPFTSYDKPISSVPQAEMERLAGQLSQVQNGLLVIGRLAQLGNERDAISALAKTLGWPVVADIGSGYRLGSQKIDGLQLLPHADLALLAGANDDFECVLHLGGGLVSRRVAEFIGGQKNCDHILVTNHPLRQDPIHRVTRRIECDPAGFAEGLNRTLKPGGKRVGDSALLNAHGAVAQMLSEILDKSSDFTEPMAARIVASEIPAGHGLFVANSLPIRDFDMYAPVGSGSVRLGCNRGASGIDGTVGSACGFARGLGHPVTLVIGDLALLHDLNSLALTSGPQQPPVTIVVINNGGGAIFSLLPVAQIESKATNGLFGKDADKFERDVIEPLFVASHKHRFGQAASMFGLGYDNPTTAEAFRQAYRSAASGGKSRIIELNFDWRRSRAVRREIQKQIAARLSSRTSHG